MLWLLPSAFALWRRGHDRRESVEMEDSLLVPSTTNITTPCYSIGVGIRCRERDERQQLEERVKEMGKHDEGLCERGENGWKGGIDGFWISSPAPRSIYMVKIVVGARKW